MSSVTITGVELGRVGLANSSGDGRRLARLADDGEGEGVRRIDRLGEHEGPASACASGAGERERERDGVRLRKLGERDGVRLGPGDDISRLLPALGLRNGSPRSTSFSFGCCAPESADGDGDLAPGDRVLRDDLLLTGGLSATSCRL